MKLTLLKSKNIIKYLIVISLFLISCSNGHKKDNGQHKYALIINSEKGSRTDDSMLYFDVMDSTQTLKTSAGSKIANTLGSYVILKDSFLLSLDKKSQTLSKYKYTANGLSLNGQLQIKGFDFIAYSIQLDQNQIYISGRTHKDKSMYILLDFNRMQLIKKGSLNLPVAKGQKMMDIFGVKQGKDLFITYSSFGEDYNHCSDTSYLARLSYPEFAVRSVTKDTRSAFPGTGVNGLFNGFEDDNGDQYVLTSPVFYHGNNATAPTAFYRIKKGTAVFDTQYFFNLSSLVNGIHLLGITYAGHGKVIVVTTPFPSSGKSDYYVADVHTMTMTLLLKDQNEPNFVWGTSGFYDGENACFIVNETLGKAQLYTYNAPDGRLRKGPSITGQVSDKSSYLLFKPKTTN